MPKRTIKQDVTEDPRYHDTWRLLKRYRDVVWSMELSVQQMKNQFQIEYGCSIEDFLDSVYLAGADLSGTDLEDHARCIERSNKMLTLVNNSIELLRTRHKHGEDYYWLLYYTYLSPQQLKNVEEIVEQLRPHIRDISLPTYYRKRKQAVEALSSVLWGFTSQECRDMRRLSYHGVGRYGLHPHLHHGQHPVSRLAGEKAGGSAIHLGIIVPKALKTISHFGLISPPGIGICAAELKSPVCQRSHRNGVAGKTPRLRTPWA